MFQEIYLFNVFTDCFKRTVIQQTDPDLDENNFWFSDPALFDENQQNLSWIYTHTHKKKTGSDIKQKITGLNGECQICSLLSKKVYFFANIGRRPNFLDQALIGDHPFSTQAKFSEDLPRAYKTHPCRILDLLLRFLDSSKEQNSVFFNLRISSQILNIQKLP